MKKKNIFIDALEVIVLAVIITYLLFNFVLISAKVNGASMYPTLLDGEFGYSFVITKNMGINRFDICVVNVENKKLVKRVIGLPNETVSYKDNQLYIDGTPVKDVVDFDVYTSDFEVTLGEDEYYCLGDNREISRDSRYYGAFDKEDVVSTHLFVFYPFDQFGYKK